jgi:heme/copper-type cytochrome/quinol oxidase subunit 3
VPRVRTLGSWVALAWLLVVYAIRPDFRDGLRNYVDLGYLLLIWFFLARTKTLSWQFIAATFAVALPWSFAIGLIGVELAGTGGLSPGSFGSGTALAALLEESLILLPLLVLTAVAPSRVRRFSVADWLLAGLTLGLAFQVVQELARRNGAHGSYNLSPISGGSSVGAVAGFAGQHILTGLITVTIGLAVACWRHAGKTTLRAPGRTGWLALGVAAPIVAWWLVVSVHAGYNAAALTGLGTGAEHSLPWLLRFGWWAGNRGFGLGWLLLGFWVVATLVDAGRLRNAADFEPDPMPHPFPPDGPADSWAARITSWAGARSSLPVTAAVWVLATGCAVVAYAGRDLIVVLVGYTQVRGAGRAETVATALARGRVAGVLVRWIRAEAIGLAADPDTPVKLRRARVFGVAGSLGLLLAGLWLGPHWAGQATDLNIRVGDRPVAWLGGTLAGLDSWWNGVNLWSYLVLVLAAIALLLISAGSPQISTVPRQPDGLAPSPVEAPATARQLPAVVGSYLGATAVAQALADGAGLLAGSVIGLLPGRQSRIGPGRDVRHAVQEFLRDPPGFIENRRAAALRLTQRDSTDAVPGGLMYIRRDAELPGIKLSDGRLLSALSIDDERHFISDLGDLMHGDARREVGNESARGDQSLEYQLRVYGSDELLVSQRPPMWAVGHNSAYGMFAVTMYYDGRGASWYVPQTLPEQIRHRAEVELDRRLIEYATVVYYPASPFRAVQITTNHPLVASALEDRMNRLAIPGHVLLEP